jgi:hypothetical protein
MPACDGGSGVAPPRPGESTEEEAMTTTEAASTIQLLGAGGFGAIIGWYVYFINRYRRADVQLGDLVTLVGVLGGGAILAVFPARSDLFGAYGIGLFLGERGAEPASA